MAEKLTIDEPVDVNRDSTARVALDLTKHIANYEDAGSAKEKPDYWFKLYRQCYLAASGADLAAIRKGE